MTRAGPILKYLLAAALLVVAYMLSAPQIMWESYLWLAVSVLVALIIRSPAVLLLCLPVTVYAAITMHLNPLPPGASEEGHWGLAFLTVLPLTLAALSVGMIFRRAAEEIGLVRAPRRQLQPSTPTGQM